MKVAVGVSLENLVIIADHESGLWLVTGLQLFALVALRGMQRDPFDVMLGDHGMFDGTDSDGDGLAVDPDDWNVFFYGCIGGVGHQFLHFFAAAHNRNAGFLYIGDDITTMLTDVELHDTLLPAFGNACLKFGDCSYWVYLIYIIPYFSSFELVFFTKINAFFNDFAGKSILWNSQKKGNRMDSV